MFAINTIFALRIDVDTWEELTKGVPLLLDLFDKYGVKASFFNVMGYEGDLISVLKHRILRKKHLRFEKNFAHNLGEGGERSFIDYFKLLRKLILPQKTIKGRKVWDRIFEKGHEFGFHGYIHVKWHSLSKKEMLGEYDNMLRTYKSVYANKSVPEGIAAPLDNDSKDHLDVIDSLGFKYASILKGKNPFHPIIEGRRYSHLQIPITVTGDGRYKSSLFGAYVNGRCSKEEWTQNIKNQIEEQLRNKQLISVYIHPRNIFSCRGLLINFLEIMKEKGCKNRLFKEIAKKEYPYKNYYYN